MVARGLSNKQVAYELEASEKTIKTHRGRVVRKMEANSFTELVRRQMRPPRNSRHRT